MATKALSPPLEHSCDIFWGTFFVLQKKLFFLNGQAKKEFYFFCGFLKAMRGKEEEEK